MIRLVRAEFLKLRSTQVWFWLLLAAVAISALFVIGPLASTNPPAVQTSDDVASMFSSAQLSYIVLFVLGVLSVTTEYRYQTITPTVLATPSRWALLTAKTVAYALVGVAYGVICLAIQLAIAVPWLATKHLHVGLGDSPTPRAMIGSLAVLALFGIIGLGAGALLRNQIVAVTVGVIFLFVIQGLFMVIPGVKHAYPYLPGGGVSSVLAFHRSDRVVHGVHLFPPAGGVVVLLLWAFIPAIVGAGWTMNRDIT